MPPEASINSILVRILDLYGMPAAFLSVTIVALRMVYIDMKEQSARMLTAFIQQAEASLKMAASVETLARAVESRK